MNTVSTTELSRMRTHQTETLLDACKIGTLSENTSSTYKSISYTYGSEVPCGFNDRSRREARDGSNARIVDAELRLPATATVTASSRVKITKRYGVAVSPELEYAVVGPPHVGPSGIVVNLLLVEGTTS